MATKRLIGRGKMCAFGKTNAKSKALRCVIPAELAEQAGIKRGGWLRWELWIDGRDKPYLKVSPVDGR